jgi:hypothetical protein
MKIERTGDTYVARDERGLIWTIELALDMNGSPFREEVWWPAASLVAIGGGAFVHFLSADTGALVKTLSLDGDLFGHFGPADDEVFYILGWRDVTAVDKTFAVRRVSRDVAVDGIVWVGKEGDRIALSAEMDPPGGWIDVVLDGKTGARTK